MMKAQTAPNRDQTGPNPEPKETQTEYSRPSGLDALQAILLLTAHLTDVLPLLEAAARIPSGSMARVGLIEGMAKRIAYNRDLVRDFYEAMGLLAGRDLSALNVADLVTLSRDLLTGPAVGEIWRAAYTVGLIDDDLIAQWILYENLTGG